MISTSASIGFISSDQRELGVRRKTQRDEFFCSFCNKQIVFDSNKK